MTRTHPFDGHRDVDMVEVQCEILEERESAIRIDDGTRKVWLPKSQVEQWKGRGAVTMITLPEWLAKAKELI